MPRDLRSPLDLPPGQGESVDALYERVRAIARENERILGDLIHGERRFRRLAKAVWQVQEDERRRLARELHDGIGQTLTALKNRLQWLAQRESADPLAEELAAATELARLALADTRELSRLLRPPVLDDLGLSAALSWLGRTLSESAALEVEIRADEIEPRLAAEIETVLFRIAQEALTNAAKHAKAETARVELSGDDHEVVLTIRDDGDGFDPERVAAADDRTGVGLRGMRDRVELFAGTLSLDSAPGEGTSIRVSLPLLTSEEAS